MKQSDKTTAPYGSWQSPIDATMLVSGAAGISEVIPEANGVWWAESRPEESGRVAIMHWQNSSAMEVTGPEHHVRTTMHEYGGGAWWVQNSILWFVNYRDQRIYEQKPGELARPISPLTEAAHELRYADMRPTPDDRWLISVCEQHTEGSAEPENYLVATRRDGLGRQTTLASGADFYGSVCLSPDGSRLAWVQWNHPNMPWDTTELMSATVNYADGNISLTDIERIAGGNEESVIQPLFSNAGILHYLSDRNDWWQMYNVAQEAAVYEVNGEIGYPPWVHGIARYGFDDKDEIHAASFYQGIDHLKGFEDSTSFSSIRLCDNKLAFASASWQKETAVYYDGSVIREPRDLGLDPAFLPAPELISFPTGNAQNTDVAHALYFQPANPLFKAPASEKPPLIVLAHGGPTSAARSQLSLAQRYWTSRGFAVVDVNYRGSSGYGRRYRKKLDGQWGIADVEDCVAVARFLVERGDVDGDRLIIRGGSAGGFTVLSALAMHDTFTAGASLYGVADLQALAEDTHKFESRYLDSLIGRWPEEAELYAQRSPINHLDGFTAPMIVLQGAEDKIVPPNQSRMIVEALEKKGIAVAYLEFAGEQHGFRQAETIVQAVQAELSFYGEVFGFKPDSITSLEIRNRSTLRKADDN
ncbi:MAG: alpha/beta hydrolase family protein [Granulosicoccus sp.]